MLKGLKTNEVQSSFGLLLSLKMIPEPHCSKLVCWQEVGEGAEVELKDAPCLARVRLHHLDCCRCFPYLFPRRAGTLLQWEELWGL